jgi:hypothetical protein
MDETSSRSGDFGDICICHDLETSQFLRSLLLKSDLLTQVSLACAALLLDQPHALLKALLEN